jgi:hypothetical protein
MRLHASQLTTDPAPQVLSYLRGNGSSRRLRSLHETCSLLGRFLSPRQWVTYISEVENTPSDVLGRFLFPRELLYYSITDRSFGVTQGDTALEFTLVSGLRLVVTVGRQLYDILVRTPDFGPRGPRFETQARRIFHDLGKVSEY